MDCPAGGGKCDAWICVRSRVCKYVKPYMELKCEKHPFWKPDVCPYCIERKGLEENVLHGELLDLIKLMPDYQVQDILNYIEALQKIRRKNNGM